MISPRSFVSVALVHLLSLVCSTPVHAGVLSEAARRQEGRTLRFSTGLYDPESNRDMYPIQAGERLTFCELDGPGEVRHIWFTIGGTDRRYPRNMVLRIYYDGSPTPSVESPIGDFFLAGNGMRANVRTYPIEVKSWGRALNCYWRMPFQRTFRMEIENQSKDDMGIYCQLNWVKLDKLPGDALYFHARYYQEYPPVPRFQTYPIAEIKGRGQYVGTCLSSQNVFPSWFGEADDRYYIDGEKQPSLVGTGLEDYFCEAWHMRTQKDMNAGTTIRETGGDDARISMYRWHLQAPVMFNKSLKVEVERRSYVAVRHPETHEWDKHNFKYRPDFFSSVAFWYHDGIAEPWCELPPPEQRLNPEILLETTDMVQRDDLGGIRYGNCEKPCRAGCRYGRNKSMTWVECHEVGGWVEIPVTVEDAGRYAISVMQCLHNDRGVWKVTLAGADKTAVLDKEMDFYDPYAAREENWPENERYGTWFEKKVGLHNLTPGDYRFRFECVGHHPLAFDKRRGGPGYNLGIDAISLRRLPIDDRWAWLQDYLAEEKALFGRWERQAQDTVTQLQQSIETYHKRHKAYPASLDDLVRGEHIATLPVDPWNQPYQYQAPGRFNPDRFDVYSWHGNSRQPERWIGNWPPKTPAHDIHEAEALRAVRVDPGVLVSVRHVARNPALRPSGGTYREIRFNQEGDVAEFRLASPRQPGDFRIKLELVTGPDHGTAQWSLDGLPIGEPVDAYSAEPGIRTVEIDRRRLGRSLHTLTVRHVGKDPASEGTKAAWDKITLTWLP